MEVKYNLWYAEDDLLFGSLVKERLKREEFRVSVFPDGQALCQEYQPGSAHLILLDYDMPGASGLDVVRKIRETDEGVPIVIYSVYADPRIAAEAYNLGVDFINKDCEWDLFLAKIRCFIRRAYNEDLKNSFIQLSETTYFDVARNLLIIDNQEVLLNKVNTCLLRILCANVNEWVSGDQLTNGIWRLGVKDKIKDLRRQIFLIREKLGPDASVRIENGYGTRYRLVIPILPAPRDGQ